MRFTHFNTERATVHDLDSRQRLERVMSIDTEAGEIVQAFEPFRIGADGEVATETLRYQQVWPIYGGGTYPVAFHCHGRQA